MRVLLRMNLVVGQLICLFVTHGARLEFRYALGDTVGFGVVAGVFAFLIAQVL